MNKMGLMMLCILLNGCNTSSQPTSSEETISPKDYQECIQAAMHGDGQASTEKCDKMMQDTRP